MEFILDRQLSEYLKKIGFKKFDIMVHTRYAFQKR